MRNSPKRNKSPKRKPKARSGQHSDAPARKPFVGASVIFMYGNPTAIGSPTVPMTAVVTSMGSADGRIVSGRAFTDPGVSGTTADGKPIQVPSLIPMIGAKYSKSGAKLTWHWRGDVNFRGVNLLRGDVAPVEAQNLPEDDGDLPEGVENAEPVAPAIDAGPKLVRLT